MVVSLSCYAFELQATKSIMYICPGCNTAAGGVDADALLAAGVNAGANKVEAVGVDRVVETVGDAAVGWCCDACAKLGQRRRKCLSLPHS